jgi:2-dehydro-3-deoxygalactonokinase
MPQPNLIAVDWGTTNLRAYLLDENGAVLARRRSAEGMSSTQPGEFPTVLERVVGEWLRPGRLIPVIMSGMVGSRQGWIEVPYVACPASLADIVGGIRRAAWSGGEVYICPGLACRDAQGNPDVLRGEEIQILGAAAELPRALATVCLPGTHSKYLTVHDGVIERFTSHMTGELFALMTSQGMLHRVLDRAKPDLEAFDRGVERARQPGGILHHMFSVRAAVLVGELTGGSATDFLSGILIGHEILAAAPEGPVYLGSNGELAWRYRRALDIAGIDPIPLPEDIAAAGLYRVAMAMRESLET